MYCVGSTQVFILFRVRVNHLYREIVETQGSICRTELLSVAAIYIARSAVGTGQSAEGGLSSALQLPSPSAVPSPSLRRTENRL